MGREISANAEETGAPGSRTGWLAKARRLLPPKAVRIGDAAALVRLARSHRVRFDGARLVAVPRGEPGPEARVLRLAIIVPTRLQARKAEAGGGLFIERAMESALAQKLDQPVALTFIAGVDADAEVPATLGARPDVVIARSPGRSQIFALNAAIALVGDAYDYAAFLEDDDLWAREFLAWSLLALVDHDFVSMSHVEIDEAGAPVAIQDFPTPSSWLMPVSTLKRVGAVNPRSKWHYDNEWLGRLGRSGLRRCHLLEQSAPLSLPRRLARPGIGHLLRRAGPQMQLFRHASERPLVIRTLHPGSGTAKVEAGGPAARESKAEYDWLTGLYGHIPW